MASRFLCLGLLVVCSTSLLLAQGPSGGTTSKDISGGANIIFPKTKDPVVQEPTGGGRIPGGGRTDSRPTKPAQRKQDPIIARANAARRAPKPRYGEAEQQYQLAAQVAPDDERAYAGLGNVYVDQGKFTEAVAAYE